ncbi:MAG TPA: hypothetical protein VMX56_00520 [Anaerolineales bacterium]|nr:hypothetical protein [Anaerolineales bacterium]
MGGQSAKKPKTLYDVIARAYEDLHDDCFRHRRKGIGRKEFEKAWIRYENELQKRGKPENFAVVQLVQRIIEANELIEYTRSCSRKTTDFRAKPIPLEGLIQKRTEDTERPFRKNILPLLEKDFPIQWFTEQEEEKNLGGAEVRLRLLPYVFLMIWTSLESYLRERVRLTVLSNPENLIRFVRQTPENKLPRQWRETGEDITRADYISRPHEIVDEYLKESFHNFRSKGYVSYVYLACYGIYITRFSRIKELHELTELRHQIVHKGTSIIGVHLVDLGYKELKGIAELVLEFADWIEEEVEEAESGRNTSERKPSGNSRGKKKGI